MRIGIYYLYIWHKFISVVYRNFHHKFGFVNANPLHFISSTRLIQFIELYEECTAKDKSVKWHGFLNKRIVNQPLPLQYSFPLDTNQ